MLNFDIFSTFASFVNHSLSCENTPLHEMKVPLASLQVSDLRPSTSLKPGGYFMKLTVTFLILIGYEALSLTVAMVIVSE